MYVSERLLHLVEKIDSQSPLNTGHLFACVWERAQDAMAISDEAGVVLAANPAYLELYGLPADKVIDHDFAVIFPEQMREWARTQYQAIFHDPKPPPVHETQVCSGNGQVHQVESRIAFIESGSRRVAMLSIIRDITRRWEAEHTLSALNAELEIRVQSRTEALNAANAELVRAAQHKDEFLANMSHELRTPLTGILSFVEALQEGVYGTPNDQQVRALSMIDESSRHLLQLINDVLDMSRIDAGRLELDFQNVDVADVVRASLHVIAPLATARRQRVHLALQPVVLTLKADPRRLKQMLVNLLSNAVKFTPEEGDLGLIVVGDELADTVVFTVWDHGIGIAPEQQGLLFRPFVQLDSGLDRQYSGSGLGLALVRRLAEAHGGTVTLTSAVGDGSHFIVTLPWKHRGHNTPASELSLRDALGELT